jgi:hypothetical protein
MFEIDIPDADRPRSGAGGGGAALIREEFFHAA